VDADRGYSDENDPRWRAGERGYDSGYADGDRFGAPQPRGRAAGEGSRYPGEGGRPAAYFSGPEADRPLPTRGGPPPAGPGAPFTRDQLFSPDEAARFHAAADDLPPGTTPMSPQAAMGQPMGMERVSMHRQAGAEKPMTDSVYRARRPGTAAMVSVGAIFVGLFMIRVLAVSWFGPVFQPGGVIAGALALSALPLTAMGLYGLATGAAHHVEQLGFRIWARPPLAYLWVGLVLLVAAALAAP
jgi:hypothetical protein